MPKTDVTLLPNTPAEDMGRASEIGLPNDVKAGYMFLWRLPNGRICGVHRLLYHWTVHVGISELGYDDRWCFAERDDAMRALIEWGGEGDMPGRWHKHPSTGRRRDPDTGEIWHESQYRGR